MDPKKTPVKIEPPDPHGPQFGIYEVTQDESQAIVIHCSQHDLQQAFEDFIEKELGMKKGQYTPFIVAGGGSALARPETLPKEFKFIKERLELLLSKFKSIRRIVIINHEGCAQYEDLCERLQHAMPKFHAHVALDDMKLISSVFSRLLSHLVVQVEYYYGRLTGEENKQIKFERVM